MASKLPNLELTIWVMMVAKGLTTPPAPGTTSKTDDGVVVAMVVPALVVVVVTPPKLVLAGNNELLKRLRLIRERGKKLLSKLRSPLFGAHGLAARRLGVDVLPRRDILNRAGGMKLSTPEKQAAFEQLKEFVLAIVRQL